MEEGGSNSVVRMVVYVHVHVDIHVIGLAISNTFFDAHLHVHVC